MTRSEATERLQAEEELGLGEALQLPDRADATGTSDPAIDLNVLLDTNRAGSDESRLSVSEILEHYVW